MWSPKRYRGIGDPPFLGYFNLWPDRVKTTQLVTISESKCRSVLFSLFHVNRLWSWCGIWSVYSWNGLFNAYSWSRSSDSDSETDNERLQNKGILVWEKLWTCWIHVFRHRVFSWNSKWYSLAVQLPVVVGQPGMWSKEISEDIFLLKCHWNKNFFCIFLLFLMCIKHNHYSNLPKKF